MWIKDIICYDVDVYENDDVIYSGNIDDIPQNLKEREIDDMKIDHKRIKIKLK